MDKIPTCWQAILSGSGKCYLFCPLFFVLLPSFLHFQVIVCNFVAFLSDFVVQCRLTFDFVLFYFFLGGGGFMICYVVPQSDCQYFWFVWGNFEKPFLLCNPLGP